MPSAGVISQQPNFNIWNAKPPEKQPSVFDAYGGSIKQTGQDYDALMENYRKLLATPSSSSGINPLSYKPVSPITSAYQQSPDVTSAMSSLKDLADTGGYTSQGINDIRARGIAPIRSVYANAQANLDRNKVLQGGYSPGYAGAQAKMARDLSAKIGEQTSNVNAGLAEQVARGRLQAAPSYANAASVQSDLANRIAQGNAAIGNETNRFNTGNELQVGQYNNQLGQNDQQRQLEIMKQMQGLYGTTPALANTFGDQALKQQQITNQQGQFNQVQQNQQQDALARLLPGMRRNG